MLPPIVLVRVAASLWPSALLVQVRLVCPSRTRKPCVQQYMCALGWVGKGRVYGRVRRGCEVGAAGGVDPVRHVVASVV